jgi:hypothetical protein
LKVRILDPFVKPQRLTDLQVSKSILNTRFKRCAQLIVTWRYAAGGGIVISSAVRGLPTV